MPHGGHLDPAAAEGERPAAGGRAGQGPPGEKRRTEEATRGGDRRLLQEAGGEFLSLSGPVKGDLLNGFRTINSAAIKSTGYTSNLVASVTELLRKQFNEIFFEKRGQILIVFRNRLVPEWRGSGGHVANMADNAINNNLIW